MCCLELITLCFLYKSSERFCFCLPLKYARFAFVFDLVEIGVITGFIWFLHEFFGFELDFVFQMHNVFVLASFELIALAVRLSVHMANMCSGGRVWTYEAVVWGRFLSLAFVAVAIGAQITLKLMQIKIDYDDLAYGNCIFCNPGLNQDQNDKNGNAGPPTCQSMYDQKYSIGGDIEFFITGRDADYYQSVNEYAHRGLTQPQCQNATIILPIMLFVPYFLFQMHTVCAAQALKDKEECGHATRQIQAIEIANQKMADAGLGPRPEAMVQDSIQFRINNNLHVSESLGNNEVETLDNDPWPAQPRLQLPPIYPRNQVPFQIGDANQNGQAITVQDQFRLGSRDIPITQRSTQNASSMLQDMHNADSARASLVPQNQMTRKDKQKKVTREFLVEHSRRYVTGKENDKDELYIEDFEDGQVGQYQSYARSPIPRSDNKALTARKSQRRYGNSEEEVMCSICMETIKNGQMIVELKCNHMYHLACCKNWLYDKNQCPMCRSKQVGSPPRTQGAQTRPLRNRSNVQPLPPLPNRQPSAITREDMGSHTNHSPMTHQLSVD